LAVLGVATETNDTFGGFLFLPPKLPYYFCWPTNGRRKYHIIFVDPPLATETEVILGGVFCVPPPKVTKYFTSPLPSPLSLTLSLDLALTYNRHHLRKQATAASLHRKSPPPTVRSRFIPPSAARRPLQVRSVPPCIAHHPPLARSGPPCVTHSPPPVNFWVVFSLFSAASGHRKSIDFL
jgi:hypothetical protein